MLTLNLDKVNQFVLARHHLANDAHIDDIVQIACDITGLHATGAKEPYLAVFARAKQFSHDQLDDELYHKRSLAKIRCMRGTLYILPRAIIPMAYAATKTLVEKVSSRYAFFQGISPELYAEVSPQITTLLSGRELSLYEIKAHLRRNMHLPSLLNLMCDRGLLVRVQKGNAWKAKTYRYALLQEYLGNIDLDRLDEDEALVLLVKHYLHSFGPATQTDIAWWIGITIAKVRRALKALKDQITMINISELKSEFVMPSADLDILVSFTAPVQQSINLLPSLDPYLMGYKERERYLSPEFYGNVFDRSGNATTTIMVDGRIVGVWDLVDEKLKLFLFGQVTEETWQRICRKAQEICKFSTGHNVELRQVASMVPLGQRPAGAFMTPLKDS